MKNKYEIIFTFLLLITSPILSFSQTIEKYLISNHKNPVSHASVFNTHSGDFTFSDESGYFKITASSEDTLSIRHIGFKTLRLPLIQITSDSIKIEEKIMMLDEVQVSSNEPLETITLGPKKKGKSLIGLPLNQDFVYCIIDEAPKKMILKSILIAVKYKKGYSNSGVFQFQLFNNLPDADSGNPLTKLYESKISNSSRSIEIEFEESIELNGKFKLYLFMKRVVPSQEFSISNSKALSVNPFIYFSGTDNDSTFFDKPINDSDWKELGKERLLTNVKLSLILKGESTE